ncbi:MAG: BACON domain-containing protein [Bacteroidales bacterium]|nr:BACON domain-containing protein [Bacteroidales bacterium]
MNNPYAKLLKYGLSVIAVPALLLTGCLQRQFIEEEGVLAVNSRTRVVPADMFEGRGLVKDTLKITSNRCWSAVFTDEDGNFTDVDWVRMDTVGHHNMARITEASPLVFSFDDNETEEERSVNVRIFTEDGYKDVTLRQEPIAYRLKLLSGTESFRNVRNEGDTLRIGFNTNTEWTATVKSNSGASVKFTASSGKYSADIDAIVMENEDTFGKDATIIISAKGCKDIEIPLSQLQGEPYLRFTNGKTEDMVTEGTGGYSIPFRTNGAWKARIVSVKGWPRDKVAMADSTGTKGSKTLPLYFSYASDFSVNEAEIVVRFSAEGVSEDVFYTIRQKPCIRIRWFNTDTNVMDGASSAKCPISQPPFSDLATSSGNALSKYKKTEFDIIPTGTDHVLKAWSTPGIWRNSSWGLLLGGAVGDFIQFPAIAGHTLKKVVFRRGGFLPASISGSFELQTPDGKPVSGTWTRAYHGTATDGIHSEGFSEAVDGFMFSHYKGVGLRTTDTNANLPQTITAELTGTSPGVGYMLVNLGTDNYSIGDLILYYE